MIVGARIFRPRLSFPCAAPSLLRFSPSAVSMPEAVDFSLRPRRHVASHQLRFRYMCRAGFVSSPSSPPPPSPPLTTTYLYSGALLIGGRASFARATRVSTQTRIREDHPHREENARRCAAQREAKQRGTPADAGRRHMNHCWNTAHYGNTEYFLARYNC